MPAIGLGLGLPFTQPNNGGAVLVRSFDPTVPTSMTASASVQFVAANAQSLSVPSSATIQTGNVSWFLLTRIQINTKAALRGVIGKTDNVNAQEWLWYYYNTPDRMQLSLCQSNGASQNNLTFNTFGSPPIGTVFNAMIGLNAASNLLVGAAWLPGTANVPVAFDTAARTVTLTAGAAAMIFGNVPGTSAFDGRINGSLWFKRAPTLADLSAWDNNGLGVMPDALPAQLADATSGWKFWEATGNRNDSIGTNHASAVNAPLRVGGSVKRQAVAGTLTTGDPVTLAKDQSGNGFDLTSDAPPTLVANVQNGLPALYFDGVSQYMTADAAGSRFAGINVPLNWRAVIKMASVGSTAVVWAVDNLVQNSGNAAFNHFGVNSTGPQWFTEVRSDNNTNDLTYKAGTPDTNIHIVDVMIDASGNTVMEVDGTGQASFVSLASTTTRSIGAYTVGCDRRGAVIQSFANFYLMDEAASQPQLVWAKRQADYAKMASKYALTVTRAGQPYYLDPAKSDGNTGLSAAQAWATTKQLNTVALAAVPGDTYTILSGASLPGGLHIQCNNAPDQPAITVNTYGGSTAATLTTCDTLVSDTFTAADGTLVTARACDTGQTAAVALGSTSPKITSNQCVGNVAGDNAVVYDATVTEVGFSLDFIYGTGDTVFVILLRYTDASNYWKMTCTAATGVCQIAEVVAGSSTNRGVAGAATPAALVNGTTYTFKVWSTRNRIFVSHDDVTGNHQCVFNTATSGSLATKFGFNLTAAGVPASKVDNFRILRDVPAIWADDVSSFVYSNLYCQGPALTGTLSGAVPWDAKHVATTGAISQLSSALLVSNMTAVQLVGPSFTNWECSGGLYGLNVFGNNDDQWSTNRKGFTAITMGGATQKAHDNLLQNVRIGASIVSGTSQHGPWNFTGTVQAYNAPGCRTISNNGYGIVVESISGGSGADLVIHDNGQSNILSLSGGPCGLELLDVLNLSLNRVEIYNQYERGNSSDGGGVDCSLGSQGVVIDTLYVHDCDGDGLQFQTSGGYTVQNNVIRNLVIERCANFAYLAGVQVKLLSGGTMGPNYILNGVIDCEINGKYMIDSANGTGGLRMSNVLLRMRNGDLLIKCVTGDVVIGNGYDKDPSFAIDLQWNGTHNASLAAFRAQGAGAENYNSINYGLTGVASLVNAGGGTTQMPTNPVTSLTAYDPTAGSFTIGAGINLDTILGVSVMPALDFHGNPAVVGGLRDIGAVKG